MKQTQLRGVVFGIILAGTAILGLGATQAQAAPSLVLLEDNGDSNPAYRQVIESLGAVIVANNLGRYYDHIDVLTGDLANRQALFAQIRKRGLKSDVDVVILTHGSDKSLALGTGDISDRDILAQGNLPRLRLVYMMACYGASLESAWRKVGAQVVVAHQDVNSLSGFFFPRFLKRWAEGATARDAAAEAYHFSEGTAAMLSNFIQEDNDLLSQVGVARSEPVLQGVDMDRTGQTYPGHALAIAPMASAKNSSSASAPAVFKHTDFENMGIAVMGSMVPQASLNVAAIPSAQGLVDRVRTVAWDGLKDSFPNPAGDGLPDLGLGLPTEDGQQIWIDGEAIRYFLDSLRDYVGDKLGPVLDHVQGVRLTRMGELLNVAIYFDMAFDIPLQDKKSVPNWQPYSVHAPKTIRFSIKMSDDVLTVAGLDEGADALNLKIKMPFPLPEAVWVRNASVNLSSGKARVEAGVAGNLIAVIANAELMARKLDGFDIWGSIEKNLNLFDFPSLHFEAL